MYVCVYIYAVFQSTSSQSCMNMPFIYLYIAHTYTYMYTCACIRMHIYMQAIFRLKKTFYLINIRLKTFCFTNQLFGLGATNSLFLVHHLSIAHKVPQSLWKVQLGLISKPSWLCISCNDSLILWHYARKVDFLKSQLLRHCTLYI